jgi:hypothetical protein
LLYNMVIDTIVVLVVFTVMSSSQSEQMSWSKFIGAVQDAKDKVEDAVSALMFVEGILKEPVASFIAKSDLYRSVSSCYKEDETEDEKEARESLLQKVEECPVYRGNNFACGRDSLVSANENFSNARGLLANSGFQPIVESRNMVTYWKLAWLFAQRTINLIIAAIDAIDYVICGNQYMYAKLLDVTISSIMNDANQCLEMLRAIERMHVSKNYQLQLSMKSTHARVHIIR